MTSQLPQTSSLPIGVRFASAAGESASTGAPATPFESAAEAADVAESPFSALLSPRLEAEEPVSPPAENSVTAGNSLPQGGSGLPFDEHARHALPLADRSTTGTVIGVPVPGSAAPAAAAQSTATAETAGPPKTWQLPPSPPAGAAGEWGPVDGRRAQISDVLARQSSAGTPSDAEIPVPAATAARSPSAADGKTIAAGREIPSALSALGPSPNGREASTATGPIRTDSAVRPDGLPPGQTPGQTPVPAQPLAGRTGHALQDAAHAGRATPTFDYPDTAASLPRRGNGSGQPTATPAPAVLMPGTADETRSTPLPVVPGGNNARDLERLAGGASGPGRAVADVVVSPRTGTAAAGATLAATTAAQGDAGERPVLRSEPPVVAGPRVPTMQLAGDEAPVGADDLSGRAVKAELAEPRLTGDVRIDRAPSVAPSLAPSLTTPVQGPAATGVATPGNTTVPNLINTPVTDPAWGETVAKRVSLLLSRNVGSAELRLSPAELGPLQVQIAVDDNVARVTFSAAHAVTRDALEQALPRLREMLADQGMSLADAGVSDQRGEAGNDGADSAPADFRAADIEANPDRAGQAPLPAVEPLPVGRLDTYV